METGAISTASPARHSAFQRISFFSGRNACQWRAFLIVESLRLCHFRTYSAKTPESLQPTSIKNPRLLETRLGDTGINALHGRRGSALSSQCLNRCARNLFPPTTVNLADLDLE